MFTGMQLENGHALSDYDVQEQSTVHLVRGDGYPRYISIKAAELSNDNESIKTLFYPLYAKILSYWFPAIKGYDICPKWTIPGSFKTDDYFISFVVEHHQHPFLLLEVKPPSDFRLDSGREAAIIQVMQRLDEIGPTNQHSDRLYAISAIGKKWRACCALKGEGSTSGQPVAGVAKVDSLKSADPDCWNPDITSDASWLALQSIVKTIKGYVAQ